MIIPLRFTRRVATVTGAAIGALPFLSAVARAQGVSGSSIGGRVLAVGIPGAGAISPVGYFHPGGPIHDKPELAAFTQAGGVLDAERILVASTSNFGAPLVNADWPEGSVLSITSLAAGAVSVPAGFASAGDQAIAQDGRVQLFTAHSPAFGQYSLEAVTAELPPVSNPLSISLNNAFGRTWIASAPMGAPGIGFESVLDPDGRPLAGAPSAVAGGVFAGDATNRGPEQLLPGGLSTGAVATALLGKSPDDSGRAVFAIANADGSIVQLHVQQGVDGLAPAGTIGALEAIDPDAQRSGRALATRAGMAFNWVPDAILYVTDPTRNAVLALTLVEDGRVFRVLHSRRIESPALNIPVDVTPAVPEVVSPVFASNTTLAGGADLYVANRGDGTIVRLGQDGTVLAVRQVEIPTLGRLGPGRINGIAVSPDAQRIWVTVSGSITGFPGQEGAVVEVPAFSAGM